MGISPVPAVGIFVRASFFPGDETQARGDTREIMRQCCHYLPRDCPMPNLRGPATVNFQPLWYVQLSTRALYKLTLLHTNMFMF